MLAACEEEGKKESETNWERLTVAPLYRLREMRDSKNNSINGALDNFISVYFNMENICSCVCECSLSLFFFGLNLPYF